MDTCIQTKIIYDICLDYDQKKVNDVGVPLYTLKKPEKKKNH